MPHQEAVRDRVVALRKLGQHVQRQPLCQAQDRAQDETTDGACASVLPRMRLRQMQRMRTPLCAFIAASRRLGTISSRLHGSEFAQCRRKRRQSCCVSMISSLIAAAGAPYVCNYAVRRTGTFEGVWQAQDAGANGGVAQREHASQRRGAFIEVAEVRCVRSACLPLCYHVLGLRDQQPRLELVVLLRHAACCSVDVLIAAPRAALVSISQVKMPARSLSGCFPHKQHTVKR